jgi:O-antigen ligase
MGWALVLALAGYPIWWLLGLELVVWPLLAAILVAELVVRPRPLRAPRGVMLWVLFIGWTVASAVVVSGADRATAWGYRTSHYVAALVVMVFLASVSHRELPTERIARAVLALWGAIVVGGILGVLLPDLSFPSVLALVLPAGVQSIDLVADSLTLQFGNTAEVLGVPRPSTLFAYTNAWAAALGVITPMALFAAGYLRTRAARAAFWALLAASIVPAVISVNRGLWLSLLITAVAAVVLLAVRGHLVAALRVVLGAVAVAVVLWVSPLGDFVRRRLFETPNLTTRENLVDAALSLTSRSPLVGWGTPVRDPFVPDSNSLSVGTHGQLWTLLVSHGVVATLLYFAFFAVVIFATRRVGARGVWLQVALVVLMVQGLFYSSVPMPLMLAAVAVGLLTRLASSPDSPHPGRTHVH